MQKEFRGVADPDQAWILGELIRYLEHSRSGALEFDDMGESWTSVRDAVAAGTVRPTDKGIASVVSRFDALLRFASLRLGRQLGTEVVPVLTRRELADPTLRAQAVTQMLCQSGQLAGAIRIPGAVGQLVITADLRSSRVTCHVDIDAPREGRPTTRVNWLVRQLKNAPDATRVECFNAHARGSSAAELLGTVRENPASLVTDPGRDLRTFRVAAITALGAKRGRGRGTFIDSMLAATDGFYAEVLQDLKAWSATPPKLRPTSPASPDAEPTKPASLSSTDFSSQDGPANQESAKEEVAAAGRTGAEVASLAAPGEPRTRDAGQRAIRLVRARTREQRGQRESIGSGRGGVTAGLPAADIRLTHRGYRVRSVTPGETFGCPQAIRQRDHQRRR